MLAARAPKFPGSDVHVTGAPSRSSGGGGFSSDDGGMILALFADMAINKGRGGADIMKYYQGAPDRDLDRDYKRAQIENLHAQATRPYGGRGQSPEALALQEERINLSRERLAADKDKTQRELDLKAALQSIDSPETKAWQDAAIAAGADEKTIRGMTGSQIRDWRPQLGQQVVQDRGQQNWSSRFGKENREFDRRAGEGEERKLQGEEREEGRTQEKRYQDFAESYADKNASKLQIAGLITDIEKVPGGAKPGSWSERLRDAAGSWGVTDPDRLDVWQAKKLIMEEWSRSRSGAAISASENENFALQAGMSPTASTQQIETAFRVLKRVIARDLAARAVPNPEAARAVGEAYGLDQSWFPRGDRARPSSSRRRAPSKPAKSGETIVGDDGDEYEVLP